MTSLTRKVNLSVVTYTYNDHSLVLDLLDSMKGWSVVPKECCVVDDGSQEPFEYRGDINGLIPTVIRLESNQGPTTAKHSGLSFASGRFVLSIDADVRLDSSWLESCLPLAAQPGVGMVSSPLFYESGSSLTGQYMNQNYSYLYDGKNEVDFISGPVFLMRKEVYADVGGLAAYPDRIGEDDYLNRLLVNSGYTLNISHSVTARQIRQISRITAIARGFTWQQKAFLTEIERGAPLDEVAQVFVHMVQYRPCMQRDTVILWYYDLLYCVYGVIQLAEYYPEQQGAISRFVLHRLVGFGELLENILSDLDALGCSFYNDSGEERIVKGFDAIFPHEKLESIQAQCGLLAQEASEANHFSMYLDR